MKEKRQDVVEYDFGDGGHDENGDEKNDDFRRQNFFGSTNDVSVETSLRSGVDH